MFRHGLDSGLKGFSTVGGSAPPLLSPCLLGFSTKSSLSKGDEGGTFVGIGEPRA